MQLIIWRFGFLPIVKAFPSLSLLVAMGVMPCLAQTQIPPPQQPPGSPPSQRFQNAISQMHGMNPSEQAQFLQSHPRQQQFLNNHPDIAKEISRGSEVGTGMKNPEHPGINMRSISGAESGSTGKSRSRQRIHQLPTGG